MKNMNKWHTLEYNLTLSEPVLVPYAYIHTYIHRLGNACSATPRTETVQYMCVRVRLNDGWIHNSYGTQGMDTNGWIHNSLTLPTCYAA